MILILIIDNRPLKRPAKNIQFGQLGFEMRPIFVSLCGFSYERDISVNVNEMKISLKILRTILHKTLSKTRQ